MAEIVATFDTKDKVLTVSMDGKKMKDVSGVEFYAWGDNGSVEIRTIKSNDDESFVTVTKILASEDGDQITETTEASKDEKDKKKEKKEDTKDLSKALFPKKFRTGV